MPEQTNEVKDYYGKDKYDHKIIEAKSVSPFQRFQLKTESQQILQEKETPNLYQLVKQVNDKVDALNHRLDHIFGKHVFIKGSIVDIKV